MLDGDTLVWGLMTSLKVDEEDWEEVEQISCTICLFQKTELPLTDREKEQPIVINTMKNIKDNRKFNILFGVIKMALSK